VKRLFAGIGLVGVALGAPAALNATTGRPAFPSAGSSGGLDSTYLPLEPVLDALAMLAWLVWAYLVVAVLVRALAVVIARLTGHTSLVRVTDRLAPRPLRRWVDLAVGGAFLASTLSFGRAVALPTPAPAIAAVAPAQPASASPKHAMEFRRYVVRPGDSLWAIAERELGSGFQWKEIFRENRGRRFPDGRCLDNPRLIHSGWDLRLPANGRSHGRNAEVKESAPARTTPSPPPAEATARAPTPEVEPSPTTQSSFESPTESVPTTQPTQRPLEDDASPPIPAPVVTLPSGAVVAASFACGVLSAELLTRRRRRRVRRLLSETDEVEMPERLVRDLRHAGATPTATSLDVAVDEVIAAWRANTGAPPRLLAAIEERRRISILLEAGHEHGLPKPAGGRISPAVHFERMGPHVRAEVRGPFPQRLRRITTPVQRGLLVPLGHAGKTAVHFAPLGVGVVSVIGEEAGEVVRQLLLAQATEAGPDDLQIMLLGISGDWFGSLPQVTASRGWDDASETLQEIQAEFIRRARLFQREGVEDIGEHLAAHPDEQLPALVVVAADPPSPMRGVLDAVAQEVRRYGGVLVAVGWRPSSSALHVTAEAGALRIETELSLPERIAPFALDEQTTQEIQQVIRAAASQDRDDETPGAVGSLEVSPPPNVVPHEAESRVRLALPPRGRTPKVTPPSHLPAVQCLGAFRITRDGTARVKGWRTKSRELLAFLVAHPNGATKERIMDELWPGADPERLQALFEKAVSVVRTQVRGQDDPRAYVLKVEDSWQLEADAWWIDALEFDRLLEEAAGAGEVEAVERLRQAIGLYAGDFCAELAYPWAEAVRERYRVSFTRACARLGEMLAAAGELDESLEALDRAIGVDPLCEDLWRRAMTVESHLGRKAAAKERFERLRALLASELDVEPDPETQRVALELADKVRLDAVRQAR
jgi:DNA-binding SARP family transcriptional activator